MQEAIAHIDESGRAHALDSHLKNSALLAGRFARSFGAGEQAYLAALWHDLGKYCDAFQDKLRNNPQRSVNHSSAGALYADRKLGPFGKLLAYVIAGHHAGLADMSGSPGALSQRLLDDEIKHLDEALRSPIPQEILKASAPLPRFSGPEHIALWVRMLFSAVVDADYLDTEAFFDPQRCNFRGGYPSVDTLWDRFWSKMQSLLDSAPSTPVNKMRRDILDCAMDAAEQDGGIFTLTVPTGGGKTLTSLGYALKHAMRHHKERIIYVIPYTSIIEQTAGIFRDFLGDEAVLEHHSSFDPDDEQAHKEEQKRNKLAAENWDAPIIVTTNVQFFESLFAAKSSRCRKLHNIANSVVVIDEAQLLSPEFLPPILNTVNLLAEHFRTTFVLSTATQPAFEPFSTPEGETFGGVTPKAEIAPSLEMECDAFERTAIHFDHNPTSWEALAEKIQGHGESVLCIVNRRNDCRELWSLIPGAFHLSALMCGAHRSQVIAEIKKRLHAKERIIVVSTQLVEAGVDFDFPVVYRAMAGLDSIAQAAGRCNREGRLGDENGQKRLGQVFVFTPPKPAPPGYLRIAEGTLRKLLPEIEANPLSQESYSRFFKALYYDYIHMLDKNEILKLLNRTEGWPFREIARRFCLIEDGGRLPLIVRYGEAAMLIDRIQQGEWNRDLFRKLQRYTIDLAEIDHKKLQESGEIVEIAEGVYVQSQGSALYREKMGFDIEQKGVLDAGVLAST
jgi:CRISPR-associated endonuclease/helicase Cas3